MSITVVKFKTIARPARIAFAVSSMVDPSKDISFYFASRNEDLSIAMADPAFSQIPFTEITTEFLAMRADDMYLDKNRTMDLLAPMLSKDFIFFEFFDKNAELYRVGYPLVLFQQRYKTLE